jgi:restriction system protein
MRVGKGLSFYAGCLLLLASCIWLAPIGWVLWQGEVLRPEEKIKALLGVIGACMAGFLLFAGYAAYLRKRKWFAKYAKESALKEMPWDEFERLVGSTFKLWGFKVQQQGGAHADGGIDLIVRKGGKKFLVQCKRYKGSVGVSIVREIFGVMVSEKFDGAYILTSGHFTKEGWAFAKGKPMKLISGAALANILMQTMEKTSKSK